MSVNARSRQSSGSVAIPAYHDFDEQAANTALDERCLARVLFRLDVLIPRVAIRRSYDFVPTVGFLFGNFGLIFGLAVIAGLALYGLSILLEGIDVHNSHDDDNDHSGDMQTSFLDAWRYVAISLIFPPVSNASDLNRIERSRNLSAHWPVNERRHLI